MEASGDDNYTASDANTDIGDESIVRNKGDKKKLFRGYLSSLQGINKNL
jgi:hypothetical protein